MKFVRVQDKETGHIVDVPLTDWRIKAGLFIERPKDGAAPVRRVVKHKIKKARGVTHE